LIRAACAGALSRHRDRLLGFVVQAPASAEPAEVARQLLAGLCAAILSERTGTGLRRTSADASRQAAVIDSVVASIAGASLLGLSASGVRVDIQTAVGTALVLAGIISLLARFPVRTKRLRNKARRRGFLGGPIANGGIPLTPSVRTRSRTSGVA